MNKLKISLILQCLVFLIPINIYVIGDWLGTGVQWALFRYQQTYLGDSLILVTRYVTFVLNGTISGRSAISLILWAVGVLLFIIATILVILANTSKDSSLIKKGIPDYDRRRDNHCRFDTCPVWHPAQQPVGVCNSCRNSDNPYHRVVDVFIDE